jgi:hypothetical protein
MPGASVELTGRDEPVYLTLTEHRTFLVRRGDRSLATFVPLAHALTRDKSPNAVRRNVQDVLSAVATAHIPTVVVYPGLVEERQELTGAAIRTLAYPAGPAGTRSALGVIPVSPLDINSIERLARALRWALYGLPSLDYPPIVAMPARAVAEFGAELPNLAPRDGGVAVLRAFTKTEQEALETGVRLIAAEDTRLGRGADELTRVHAELLAAHRALRALRTCPICGIDADRKFEPRDGSTFQCGCPSPSCESVWGTRICGQCHERFPVLSFGLRQATVTTGDDLDRFFGNEVLAVPCPGLSQDDAGQQFRCPWCAHCPHHRADPCTVPASTVS